MPKNNNSKKKSKSEELNKVKKGKKPTPPKKATLVTFLVNIDDLLSIKGSKVPSVFTLSTPSTKSSSNRSHSTSRKSNNKKRIIDSDEDDEEDAVDDEEEEEEEEEVQQKSKKPKKQPKKVAKKKKQKQNPSGATKMVSSAQLKTLIENIKKGDGSAGTIVIGKESEEIDGNIIEKEYVRTYKTQNMSKTAINDFMDFPLDNAICNKIVDISYSQLSSILYDSGLKLKD